MSFLSLSRGRLQNLLPNCVMHKYKNIATAVVALAGRKIDRPGHQPQRFPLENVQEVSRRIGEAFSKIHAVTLVWSAACGADLVALEQPKWLGLRRRIGLPFAPKRFPKSSVIDRPGDWGRVYEEQNTAAAAVGDFLVRGPMLTGFGC